MAKRSRYTTPDFPGLFDDQERTPYTPQPVQTDIARHSTLLEGGLNAFPHPVAPASPLGQIGRAHV